MRNALLFITLFSLFSVPACFAKPIDRREAARIAERFIRQNGYTEYKPSAKSAKRLAYESIEWTSSRAAILKFRHNTLQSHACGYAKGRKGKEPGWTVVFRFASNGRYGQDIRNGRAVTMNPDGGAIRVEHVDAIIKAFHPLN